MGGKCQKLLKPREVRLVIGDILKRDSSRKLYIKPLNEDFLLDELCTHSKYYFIYLTFCECLLCAKYFTECCEK